MKKRAGRLVVLLAIILAAAWGAAKSGKIRFLSKPGPRELTLSGNVDDREVNLAFIVPERIAEINVEEGTVVKKGDLLASLETVRLENNVAESQSAAASAQAAYEKAVSGFRPEEIAMAEAGVRAVEAKIKGAESKSRRNRRLADKDAASEQEADDAEANYKALLAELDIANENLKKMKAGTRKEDIAAAKANLDRANVSLAIARQTLADSKLYAPEDGIIRSRILEPGEMASPQKTVLKLAIVTPKWIRVYLEEPYLAKIKAGDKAAISWDGGGEGLEGWVGFISPSAEFTPKNVETKTLRPSLVYEVRVYVNDPENRLKLGSPADVAFPGVTVAE